MSDEPGNEAADVVTITLPKGLGKPLRRWARASKRFRPRWEAANKTATTAQVAQAMFATLVREAVMLIDAEEKCDNDRKPPNCPTMYSYVLDLLDLDHSGISKVATALSNALVQNGLVEVIEDGGDMWRNCDGSYFVAGEIGAWYKHVYLTEKGKAWAATIQAA